MIFFLSAQQHFTYFFYAPSKRRLHARGNNGKPPHTERRGGGGRVVFCLVKPASLRRRSVPGLLALPAIHLRSPKVRLKVTAMTVVRAGQ